MDWIAIHAEIFGFLSSRILAYFNSEAHLLCFCFAWLVLPSNMKWLNEISNYLLLRMLFSKSAKCEDLKKFSRERNGVQPLGKFQHLFKMGNFVT